MITSLRLVDFKNFTDETLRLGPFTVIIGANASGKSNIRDAFRFLNGIGRGYTLAEIIGGKYGGGGQIEWEPIRGATKEITRFTDPSLHRYLKSTFSIQVDLELKSSSRIHYSIKVGFNPTSPDEFRVLEEELELDSVKIYSTSEMVGAELHVLVGEDDEWIDLSPSKPILTQFFDTTEASVLLDRMYSKKDIELDIESDVLSAFSFVRFLELSPNRMRQPAFPGQPLGESGENLPTVLQEICSVPKRQEMLASWVQELTPMDVEGFEFPNDPSGRVHLMIRERNGREVSAYSASDGTLRFLAMLAALLGTKPAHMYFFEEIDNGLHPSRLHLLVDLIEQQTAKRDIQVITTTHSPALLSTVNEKTFENTSVVCRLEDTHDAIIRPVANLSNARELRKSQGLGRLLAGGWMETALAFTEGNEDDAEGSE